MNIKNFLSEIHVLLFIKLIPYMLHEYWGFSKNMVRCQMSNHPEKLLTEILMLTHSVEKAFSLERKRRGFGVVKVSTLVGYIHTYINKYGYSRNLCVPISLVLYYLDYQKQHDSSDVHLIDIKNQIDKIVEFAPKDYDFSLAGSIYVTKEEMIDLTNIPFSKLAKGRHSFRNFGKDSISQEIINKALDIARNTPTACNRQAYRVHIFDNENKDLIMQLQGGCKSFYRNADKAILITGDCNRYFSTEMHLPYVDGALFAMSLIYALTSLGVASIPLTMSRKLSTLKNIKKRLQIPENEIPVLLIAIGSYPESADISMSSRNNIESFTTYH